MRYFSNFFNIFQAVPFEISLIFILYTLIFNYFLEAQTLGSIIYELETKIFQNQYPNNHDSNPVKKDKFCSPFARFRSAFNNVHSLGHSEFKQFLIKRRSILIHDYIECQQKHFFQKLQTASFQRILENAPSPNNRIWVDSKGPFNLPSQQKSYIQEIPDDVSHFVVTVPIKRNNAQIGFPFLTPLFD